MTKLLKLCQKNIAFQKRKCIHEGKFKQIFFFFNVFGIEVCLPTWEMWEHCSDCTHFYFDLPNQHLHTTGANSGR